MPLTSNVESHILEYMEQKHNLRHEAIDRLVATVFSWFTRASSEHAGDVAFSDEWERKQIARELHWN
jgi:hypothetical protein